MSLSSFLEIVSFCLPSAVSGDLPKLGFISEAHPWAVGVLREPSQLSSLDSDEILFDFEEFSIDKAGAQIALLIYGTETNRDKAFVTDTIENFFLGLVGAADKKDLACTVLAGDSGHCGNLEI